MLNKIYKIEFEYIVKDILSNEEFLKTKEKVHHGITRYDHLVRVAYYSFLVSKFLKLNYVETTRAALLHDFFLDETKDEKKHEALRNHPKYALENAKKYYDLTPLQEDIITSHMFPVTCTPPKYFESWIVDLVDDVAGIYEQYKSSSKAFKAAVTYMLVFIINYIEK